MNKLHILEKEILNNTGENGLLDSIYNIPNYSGDYDTKYDYSSEYTSNSNGYYHLSLYRSSPVGFSSFTKKEKSYIALTEKNEYDILENLIARRSNNCLNDDLQLNTPIMLMATTALKNSISIRVKNYNDAEYIIGELVDWKKTNKLTPVEPSYVEEGNNSYYNTTNISHLYMSNGPTTIYANIRGVEIKYTQYFDRYLNTYIHILPPDVFKYVELYDIIDSVTVRHTHKKVVDSGNIYPTILFYDRNNDGESDKGYDISGSLTNSLNNMNLITQ